ncbi:MAG: Hsp20/alpha crystallin family protein [Acidimicrobiia bacterium]
MLVRYDPFRQLDRMTDEMFGPSPRRPQLMAMDAVRHGPAVELRFDLPGVSPDAVELTVERDVLTVRAERSWVPADGDEVLANERPQGAVTRQVILGESLDTEHLDARYDAGVLTVTIPMAEQAKARKVEIQTGAAPDAIEVHAKH